MWGEIAQQRLKEIAACSAGDPGVTRFPFTPEHSAALAHIEAWMRRAGLTPHLDAAGTLVGRLDGEGPTTLLGSHQDSVRHAGRYDGIMGIALACLAVEKLRAEGVILRRGLEVLAFADEEGVRFPTALLGPRALAGTVDPGVFAMQDVNGHALGAELAAFGGDPKGVPNLARKPEDVRAYLEVHIEQGPVLEIQDAPVGVVTGICGIERNTVIFGGETGHAGTVPMQGRADALVSAADFISQVHDNAMQLTDLRATVGTCRVSPNVANGIPDRVELTLEIRAPDDAARTAFADAMRQAGTHIAAQRATSFELAQTYVQTAVPCAPDLIDLLQASVAKSGQRALTLPSGATHDASAMADLCDVGMLFVRCRKGLSHRPEEYASAEDMDVAVDVMATAVHRLDQT